MNKGRVPGGDVGTYAYETYPTELYAELFAFMSLVHPNAAQRRDFGKRSRKLLMFVMRKAAPGRKANTPFRDPVFSTGDRSRYYGEAFGLTVDWAYPYFSRKDKKLIRKVFLRWAKEQYRGYPLDQFRGQMPSPGGQSFNPALISDPVRVRWSLNNYYIGHARNLGLMAMALDARDDPGEALRSHLNRVTGQWLFVINKALTDYAPGGLSPEGFEYGADSFGRLAQLITAMRTAGASGWQTIAANPAWSKVIESDMLSLPYSPTRLGSGFEHLGDVFQPASFGDEEKAWMLDPIGIMAPLAIDAQARGETAKVQAIRWIETNVPEGGASKLLYRLNSPSFFSAILYFLIFDPAAPPAADPRPALPLRTFIPALDRTLARTCWCPNDRLFAHMLGFHTIDHQLANANDFAFARNGEWLTRNRVQYESTMTDFANSVTIENDRPSHGQRGHYTYVIWQHGSQYILIPSGDPVLVARSSGPNFTYVTGDATNLYNSTYEGATSVSHASRSIVWLEPDHIVVYDRAETTKPDRFKRFWLQLPTQATVSGNRSTVRTPRGQQLFVTTLLPAGASITSPRNQGTAGAPAEGVSMKFRLRVEAHGDPLQARFLHVLQGADGGAPANPAALLQSSAGSPYQGALVAGQAVLFPAFLGPFGGTTVPIPSSGVSRVLVTGLTPGGSYSASASGGQVRVTPDGGQTADSGGVLVVTP